MEKELERIIQSVKEKTGISVDCISLNGVISVSGSREYTPFNISDELKEITKVTERKSEDKTYFPFEFGGVKFIGRISGVSEVNKTFATLILDLIESNTLIDGESNYESGILAILKGEFSKNKIQRFLQKYSVKDSPSFVTCFQVSESKTEELKNFLNNYSANETDIALNYNDKIVFLKFLDGFDSELSCKDYVKILLKALYEETGAQATAYVGAIQNSFTDINVSLKQALDTEEIVKFFEKVSDVHLYKDYVLYKIVEEIPEDKVSSYLKILTEGEKLLKSEELIETANGFLENNLNVSETARNLYIHRNTLMYRLDKIYKETGLDLRNFNDAKTFSLISVLSKYANQK